MNQSFDRLIALKCRYFTAPYPSAGAAAAAQAAAAQAAAAAAAEAMTATAAVGVVAGAANAAAAVGDVLLTGVVEGARVEGNGGVGSVETAAGVGLLASSGAGEWRMECMGEGNTV